MNPLPSSKCARRVLVALAAMTSIFLTVGCGSSGSIPSLGGGFSKSSLKGQYVISQTGVGVEQPPGTAIAPFSETIIFTADGNGKLTATVDDFDQVGQAELHVVREVLLERVEAQRLHGDEQPGSDQPPEHSRDDSL